MYLLSVQVNEMPVTCLGVIDRALAYVPLPKLVDTDRGGQASARFLDLTGPLVFRPLRHRVH
ncbi:hypothetical protein BN2476_530055 [Paraburkholderia piptadeniae]|uniref:Uncharacterized protein n=1 Tax=Paraburkholderia piptadeniae TaxID=1701573 RepID=A0A1N7SHR7_9BURK|nr:hypothetical protein BN2476_530055 [Paraburkholderia piptadeniae]